MSVLSFRIGGAWRWPLVCFIRTELLLPDWAGLWQFESIEWVVGQSYGPSMSLLFPVQEWGIGMPDWERRIADAIIVEPIVE